MLLLSWSLRSFAPRFKAARSGWFWAVVGVTLVGLGLRAFHLGSGSLWYDEAFSALAAERPFAQMLDATAYDVHPPLYYIILWAWFRLWPGTGRPSEAWLRLPSLLFSVLSIPLTWSFARGFKLDRCAALLAAALMAVLPFQIFYGQETRQYSLLLFTSLLTVVCWQRRWWSGMCVGLIGCMYTHNLGVIWAGVFGLLALLEDRSTWRRLLWAGFGAGLAYLPWAVRLIVQLSQWGAVGYWLPEVTPGGFVYAFHALLWTEHTPYAIALPGLFLSMSLLILASAQPPSLLRRLFWVPPLVIVAISILIQPIFFARGLIMVTPAFYTLIASGLLRLDRLPRWLLGAALAGTLAVALTGFYFDPRLQKWDHRAYSSVIADGWQAGDTILCAAKCLPFMWYLDKPVYTLPYIEDRLHCVLSPGTLRALDIAEVDRPEQIAARRLWFVWTVDPSTTEYQLETRARLNVQHPRLIDHPFIFSRLAEGTISLYNMEFSWKSD